MSSPDKMVGLVAQSATLHGECTNVPDGLEVVLPNGDRKRRRSVIFDRADLGNPFTISPSPSALCQKSLTLVPKLLISRSSIPLPYLCLNDFGLESAPHSRLFATTIHVLERESTKTANQPQVLVTETAEGTILYAVERVQQGIYALYRLCDWVLLDDFGRSPSKAAKHRYRAISRNDIGDNVWWKAAAVKSSSTTTTTNWGEYASIQPNGVRLLMEPPTISIAPKPLEKPIESALGDPGKKPSSDLSQHMPEDSSSVTPEDSFATVRLQYLELLYVSKASLAYFAKGPLSRVRMAFHQHEASLSRLPELVELLRGSVLSVATNDKKYKASIPDLIKEIPIGVTSDDEDFQSLSRLGGIIRKSKKRKKISKEGLLPGEEEYVMKWWMDMEKNSGSWTPNATRETMIKTLLVEQRFRETQLQIIIILEVLALEAAPVQSIEQPLSIGSTESTISKSGSLPKKPKKPKDLSLLLDVLIDRLCIWQSMNQDEGKRPGNELLSSSIEGWKDQYYGGSDHLRDFCKEVIIPFYASRLPDTHSVVCKKLGGQFVPSPVRPLGFKGVGASKSKSKTNVNLQERSSKPRRGLDRHLTDVKATSRRPRTLLARSATESALPTIKRELSEISLSTISILRPSLQESRRYSQREVDLTAAARSTQAKLQRKAAIENELRGAIATLKRPNPRMAVKELVDSKEARTAGMIAKSKKAKNPSRNPFGQGVQIMATPNAQRRKDIYGRPPNTPGHYSDGHRKREDVLAPSDLCIPSSSIKPTAAPMTHIQATLAPSDATPRSILQLQQQSTPSRRGSKLAPPRYRLSSLNVHDEGQLTNLSPELPPLNISNSHIIAPPNNDFFIARGSMDGTPSKKQTPGILLDSPAAVNRQPIGIQETPAKAAAAPRLNVSALGGKGNQESSPASGLAGPSIYQTLGWDDDIDDLI